MGGGGKEDTIRTVMGRGAARFLFVLFFRLVLFCFLFIFFFYLQNIYDLPNVSPGK